MSLLLQRSLPRLISSAVMAVTLLLSACVPVNPEPPTATALPTGTMVATATIVWFPPSETPTALAVPTYTATPEMSPGIGAAVVSDDFTDSSLWDTAVSDQGSAAIGNHLLSIAVQPGVYLASMRHDLTLGDFYAEITARPSLCRGDDSYGILVRSTGQSFYRFTLSCNGFVRVERIRGGVRLQLQEPTMSGDATAAPGEVRIGIWAVGRQMRLFLNGRYQLTIDEQTFPSGGFGVFVRSAGKTPVSVTFSDFEVYQVDYILPTKTPLPQ